MSLLPILLGALAAAGVWLLATGIVASRAGDATTLARARLARQEIGLGQSAAALELERPLAERLLAPGRRWLSRQLNRMTPAATSQPARRNACAAPCVGSAGTVEHFDVTIVLSW